MIRFALKIDRLKWFNGASAVYLLLLVPFYWNIEAYDTTLWEKFLVAHIVVIRFAIGWVATALADRETSSDRLLDIPILLYLGLAAISWLSAINSLKSGMEVVRILLAATLYFSVSRTYRPEYRDLWMGAGSFALGVVSAIGILQYLGIGFLDWRSAGLPSSTFFYRNYAAMFVGLTLPVSLGAIALSREDGVRVFHAVCATLGAVFLIYTRTRGAWLGVGGGICAAALTLWYVREPNGSWTAWSRVFKSNSRLATVCVVAIVIASLFPPASQSELETLPLAKSSAADAFVSILAGQSSHRVDTWIQSLQMIVDNPLFGVGIGNWDAEYLKYAGSRIFQTGGLFDRPHNDYLWVVSELGFVGLALFLCIFGGAIWLVVRRLLTASEEDTILMVALGAGLVAISIHAFFSFPRERMTSTVVAFLFIGWISALSGSSRVTTANLVGRVWRPAIFLLLVGAAMVPTLQATRSFRAYFWADAYRTVGRHQDGLNAIDAAISRGVVSFRFYELKALLHMNLGQPVEALDASKRLLEYHPYNPWNYHKVGMFEAQLGNLDAAKDAFQEGLKYGPRLGRVHRDLGHVYEQMGLADSARVSYEKALPLIGPDALLRTRYASLLADQGEFEEAQTHIQVAADRFKFTRAHADVAVVGDVAMKAKAYQAAVMSYQRATVLQPDSLTYSNRLVDALVSAGDTDGAVEVLRGQLGKLDEDSRQLVSDRIEELRSEAQGAGDE